MRVDKKALCLYAVTDRMWLGEKSLHDQVEDCIKGGVTFVQLREKNISFDEYVSLGKEIRKVTRKYQVPFVINDEMEVAIACRADGVHVGQKDMEVGDVRRRIGAEMMLGVSVQTAAQALLAQEQGADYLGVGAVFTTSTKRDAASVSFETLKEICQAVSIPVIAIGGISKETMMNLKGSGIVGVAVVSAIFAQKNIQEAAKELRSFSEELINQSDIM